MAACSRHALHITDPGQIFFNMTVHGVPIEILLNNPLIADAYKMFIFFSNRKLIVLCNV